MNDILNKTTQGTTKPASKINANAKPPPITIESIHDLTDTYFLNHEDPEIRAAYKKGQIFSLKDDFDFLRFFKSISTIFEERMSDNNLTAVENQQVKAIFNTIDKCVDVLKTINMSSSGSEILPILINYCLSSFSRYNNSYVKSREV